MQQRDLRAAAQLVCLHRHAAQRPPLTAAPPRSNRFRSAAAQIYARGSTICAQRHGLRAAARFVRDSAVFRGSAVCARQCGFSRRCGLCATARFAHNSAIVLDHAICARCLCVVARSVCPCPCLCPPTVPRHAAAVFCRQVTPKPLWSPPLSPGRSNAAGGPSALPGSPNSAGETPVSPDRFHHRNIRIAGPFQCRRRVIRTTGSLQIPQTGSLLSPGRVNNR